MRVRIGCRHETFYWGVATVWLLRDFSYGEQGTVKEDIQFFNVQIYHNTLRLLGTDYWATIVRTWEDTRMYFEETREIAHETAYSVRSSQMRPRSGSNANWASNSHVCMILPLKFFRSARDFSATYASRRCDVPISIVTLSVYQARIFVSSSAYHYKMYSDFKLGYPRPTRSYSQQEVVPVNLI